MDDRNLLAEQFEANRTHLRAVAYRMLGSTNEADDAVQEAWIRLNRSDASAIDNLSGWLTTVVGRVCLDMLRSRGTRREDPLHPNVDDTFADDRFVDDQAGADPEHQALQADAIGAALLVVLETLAPAERVAFVLHDLFAVPFDEIAPIIGRSPEAARQLASRARRRVQGPPSVSEADRARRREIVAAFLAAARNGDLAALLTLLDPDVVLRSDDTAVETGADRELRGSAAVANTFVGRAKAAQPVLVNGAPGLMFARGGEPFVVFDFAFDGDTIVGIDLLADRDHLGAIDLTVLGS